MVGRFLPNKKKDGSDAVITLRYGYPGLPPTIVHHIPVPAKSCESLSVHTANLVARFWGKRYVDSVLVASPEGNSRALVTLGRAFGLVTPNTSLLVLETLEQHLKHGVAPSSSRPALLKSYQEQFRSAEADTRSKRLDKVSRVRGWWTDRVQWYSRDFYALPAAPSALRHEIDFEAETVMLSWETASLQPMGFKVHVKRSGGESTFDASSSPFSFSCAEELKASGSITVYVVETSVFGKGPPSTNYTIEIPKHVKKPVVVAEKSEYEKEKKMKRKKESSRVCEEDEDVACLSLNSCVEERSRECMADEMECAMAPPPSASVPSAAPRMLMSMMTPSLSRSAPAPPPPAPGGAPPPPRTQALSDTSLIAGKVSASDGTNAGDAGPSIVIQKWDPNMPYLNR